MLESEVIERIVALATAGEAARLRRAGADAALVEAGEAAFGSWEGALAAALVQVAGAGGRSQQAAPTRARAVAVAAVEAEPIGAREVQEGWDGPVVLATLGGDLCYVGGDGLETARALPAEAVDVGVGGIARVLSNPEEDTVLLVSERGVLYPVDGRMIPHRDGVRRRVADLAAVASDEAVVAMMTRQALRAGTRFLHVSSAGLIKASDVKDIGRVPDHAGTVVLLLNEGDTVAATFAERLPLRGAATVFCASLGGNGIHFDLGDVRTMGLKARGVKAMEVIEPDAVADAFLTVGVEEIVALSAGGLGKRVALSEFRVQGRAGQGIILMRPPRNVEDEIAVVLPLPDAHADLVIGSLEGRLARVAAAAIPLLPRAAAGVPVVDLPAGDRVYSACTLPGSG